MATSTGCIVAASRLEGAVQTCSPFEQAPAAEDNNSTTICSANDQLISKLVAECSDSESASDWLIFRERESSNEW